MQSAAPQALPPMAAPAWGGDAASPRAMAARTRLSASSTLPLPFAPLSLPGAPLETAPPAARFPCAPQPEDLKRDAREREARYLQYCRRLGARAAAEERRLRERGRAGPAQVSGGGGERWAWGGDLWGGDLWGGGRWRRGGWRSRWALRSRQLCSRLLAHRQSDG